LLFFSKTYPGFFGLKTRPQNDNRSVILSNAKDLGLIVILSVSENLAFAFPQKPTPSSSAMNQPPGRQPFCHPEQREGPGPDCHPERQRRIWF